MIMQPGFAADSLIDAAIVEVQKKGSSRNRVGRLIG
jgi:hypothetical protein